jgi:hypothetical protein
VQKDYRCTFGTGEIWSVVGLASCNIAKRAYDPNPPTDPQPPFDPTPPGPNGGCDIGWGDLLNGSIVFKAVGCAMSWAFVPTDTTLETSFTEISTAAGDTAFGEVSTAVDNFISPIVSLPAGSSAGCQGPEVSLTWVNSRFSDPIYPLDVCAGLPKKIHDWALPLILIGMWGAALMSSWFFVAQAFGMAQ